MRLPKSLWRLLRSKRFHRFLVLAPFVAVLGIVIFYWGVNAWGQAKLDTTRERMGEMGISLPVEIASGDPEVSDSIKSLFRDARSLFPRDVFKQAGFEQIADWHDFLIGTGTYAPGDLRILAPHSSIPQSQASMAAIALSSLDQTRTEVEPALEVLRSPKKSGFQNGRELAISNQAACNTGWFLLLHSALLAKAGELERAPLDFDLAIQLGLAWRYPTPSIAGTGHRIIGWGGRIAPILIHECQEQPHQLEKLDETLASIDSVDFILLTIRAEELRLRALAENYSQMDQVINSPGSFDLDDLPWGGNAADWSESLDNWRWRVQPVGFRKANLAKDIDCLLPMLRRLPGISRPPACTFADIERYEFHIDPRAHAFTAWYDGWTYIPDDLGEKLSWLLDIRFQRLSIAAELHRHQTGTYPENLEQLTPDPSFSPFDGQPIQLSRLPDGRIRLEAAGAVSLPDGTRHYDPATPIVFTYPPKP